MVFNPDQGYLRDILSQPAALAATHRYLVGNFSLGDIPNQLAAGKFRRIVLTGMGSSHFIFYPFYYQLLKRSSLPVTHIECAELVHYAPDLIQKDTLVITASQSGSSAETVRLLEMNRSRGATVLGITNEAGSALANEASLALITQAGPEATVSCKTYLSALLVLRWLQDGLLGDDLSGACEETASLDSLVEAYLDHWEAHVEFLKGELAAQHDYFMCGRGPSLAAVMTGALTAKESTLAHVEGMSCPALRHGPKEMTRKGTYVMVFAGAQSTAPLNRSLAGDLSSQGAHVAWVGSDSEFPAYRLPPVPSGLLPLVAALPGQMFNLALADLNGHTAGVFEHASKVTSIE